VLSTSTVWGNTSDSVFITGLTNVVQQTIANGATNRFFRLHRP
jgi:acyl-coenzyme A synthetase/AMP-(fatty) acid ligase